MAGWQTVVVSNDSFRVAVASRSWWRWGWGRHVPYFVGQTLRFSVRVETLKETRDNNLSWSLSHADNTLSSGDLVRPPFGGVWQGSLGQVLRDRPVEEIVELPMLGESGEYEFHIGPAAGAAYHPTAYSFSVATLEGFLIKFLAPLLFGTFSIGLGIVNACNPG